MTDLIKLIFKPGDLVVTKIEDKLELEFRKQERVTPKNWPIDSWDINLSTPNEWKRVSKILIGEKGFITETYCIKHRLGDTLHYCNVYFGEHNKIYRIRERNLKLIDKI
jgi:hypothetical protein